MGAEWKEQGEGNKKAGPVAGTGFFGLGKDLLLFAALGLFLFVLLFIVVTAATAAAGETGVKGNDRGGEAQQGNANEFIHL